MGQPVREFWLHHCRIYNIEISNTKAENNDGIFLDPFESLSHSFKLVIISGYGDDIQMKTLISVGIACFWQFVISFIFLAFSFLYQLIVISL